MAIAEQIEKLFKVKEKIREAIISKGVDVPADATLDQMADKTSVTLDPFIYGFYFEKEKKHA